MLGIVIVNYNTWELTIKCVDSIKKTTNLNYKIYIVDNCSSNDSYNRLKEYYKNDTLIEVKSTEYNLGYAGGADVGVDLCISDKIKYAVITNNDVLFDEGAIQSMYNFIIHSDKAVIAAPKVFDINRNLMTSSFIDEQGLLQYLGLISKKKLQIDESCIIEPVNVYSVSGCCFTIDIKRFRKMGAFDRGTFLYNEEGAISVQARRHGFDIVLLPDSTIIHNHSSTTGKSNLFTEAELLKSGMYHWKKFRGINNIQVTFIFLFSLLKTILKIALLRVSKHGFKDYLKDSTLYFIKILKTNY